MIAALNRLLREKLIAGGSVEKLGPVRRASVVFTCDSTADSVFFLDSGLIKIVKPGKQGKEVVVSIVSPGQIFGEQALTGGGLRNCRAEVLKDGIVYEIPRRAFLEFCRAHPEVWQYVAELLIERSREYEQKIGMLCLNDVETRILYYLSSLSPVLGTPHSNGHEYSLPLSQSDLASLIGATRETTSTTLNLLARRGLLKLGRRLLTVPSDEALRSAVQDRLVRVARV